MSQRRPEEFTQMFALPGLEITMVSQAPPDATGPLGRIANWLRPAQSEYVIGFYATTIAFDAEGQQRAHDYFPSPGERSGMYETSRAIAEYCHEEPNAAAIYLDNSARHGTASVNMKRYRTPMRHQRQPSS